MKAIPFACACTLLSLSLAPTVLAQQRQLSAEQKQAVQERLRSADSNGDGFIDRAEADAGLPRIARRFDQIDSDDDGRLSPDELKALGAQFAQRRR